jgi:diguanylate cyclase (GGDEF)-like protein/hemerythrin-like metal-binding protein
VDGSARGLSSDAMARHRPDELLRSSASMDTRETPASGGGAMVVKSLGGSAHQVAVRRALPGSDWALVVVRNGTTQVAYRLFGIAITLLLGAVVLAYFIAMQRQVGVESAISTKHQEAEGRAVEMARQADTDALTGVLNRHGFNSLMSRELARARRYTHPLSVVMLDIDHFKSVNDRFGHPAGDKVLVAVAALLETYVRESDRVARWGGEEFVVIAPMTNLAGAAQLAEKLRALLEDSPLGPDGPITASFGIAEVGEGDTAEAFLHRADQALYRAKTSGRNRVEGLSRATDIAGNPWNESRREDDMVGGKQLYAGTGFPPIDREHLELSNALESFVQLVNAGNADQVRPALAALITGVSVHFQHEESLMAEFFYPQCLQHEEAHALFVDDVRRFQNILLSKGLTPDFRRWAVGRLLEWFRFHILAHDVGLGQFLKKVGASGTDGATRTEMPRPDVTHV